MFRHFLKLLCGMFRPINCKQTAQKCLSVCLSVQTYATQQSYVQFCSTKFHINRWNKTEGQTDATVLTILSQRSRRAYNTIPDATATRHCYTPQPHATGPRYCHTPQPHATNPRQCHTPLLHATATHATGPRHCYTPLPHATGPHHCYTPLLHATGPRHCYTPLAHATATHHCHTPSLATYPSGSLQSAFSHAAAHTVHSTLKRHSVSGRP